jgi:hypothetical protein
MDIFYEKFGKYVKMDLTIISRLVTTWNGVPYFVSPIRKQQQSRQIQGARPPNKTSRDKVLWHSTVDLSCR